MAAEHPTDDAVPLSAYLALKKELTAQNLARVDLLLQQSIEDDDATPEGLDEPTANYLVKVTEKVKSSLLTLTEHHNADIGSLLESLAVKEDELGLVQAKLSSVLATVAELIVGSNFHARVTTTTTTAAAAAAATTTTTTTTTDQPSPTEGN